MSECGRNHRERKQKDMRQAEIQNGITANNAVIAHFVLTEIDEHAHRARRMNEERNRIQKFLFEDDGQRRNIDADIADKERNARENGMIHVVSVPDHHGILAVILNEHDDRGGNEEIFLRFPFFFSEKEVCPDGKSDEHGDHEEMPERKIPEPPKTRTAEIFNIEKVFKDIQRHTGENRKRQPNKALRFDFVTVPDKQERAGDQIERVREKK